MCLDASCCAGCRGNRPSATCRRIKQKQQEERTKHVPHPLEIRLKAVESRLVFAVAEAEAEAVGGSTERIAAVGSGPVATLNASSMTASSTGSGAGC